MSSSFLTNDDYLILSRFLSLFSTSYGSNARFKLIETLDTSMSVCTSISSRIQHQLKCQHLISRLLSAAIQKQISIYHDGGLYFSIVFCSLLIEFNHMSLNDNKQNIFFENCLNIIDEMNLTQETITFNSVQQLLAIVRSVLCKPLAYDSSDLIREKLCLLSVKAFLESVTMINASKQQFTLTIEGLSVDQSSLFDGLLYQTSKIDLCSTRKRSCLYFTISLAGDYVIQDLDHIETETEMFEWIQNTAERIAKQILSYTRLHHGGLIFCQKVIHPSIKAKLKHYGIDTIDRLGLQYTSYMCYLIDCQPVETLVFDTLDERYFGVLTEIKQIEIENKYFLQFINQARSFHTLLLCSNTEQALMELKECMAASHHTLLNILVTKKVFYGGGCTESMQIRFLKSQTNQLIGRCLMKVFRNLIRAQNDYNYMIDRIHGHLWHSTEDGQLSKTCACELYSTTNNLNVDWNNDFFYLDNEEYEKLSEDKKETFLKNVTVKYLDNAHMKTNALRTAIETAININLTSICL